MILPTKEFLKVFKETPGALSVCESIAIMNITSKAPMGHYVEFGTYHGKSAMSAMIGLKRGVFYLLDPIFSDKKLSLQVQQKVEYFSSKEDVITVWAIDEYSIEYIPKYDDCCYVFIDSGSHQDGLPMQEVKLLEDRIVEGGIIAFHDYKNQFTEVEQAYNYLLSTGKYCEVGIDWQPIFDYVKEHNLEEGNNSWHIYDSLPHPPNFVGALKRI